MRAITITFSSIAFALLLVLGAVANFWTGMTEFGTPGEFIYQSRLVGTLLGDIPGLLFVLGGLVFALYDAAQRHATRWFIALLIWPVFPLLASTLMFAGILSYGGLWFVLLAFLPLATFLYGLVAAPLGPRPAPLAPAPGRYITFVGVLAATIVVLGALLIAPVPQALVSPPGSLLQGVPAGTYANCAKGNYPGVQLANVSSYQTITWTAKSQDPHITITPSSGSLAPDATMFVDIEGASSARQVTIQFTPNIGLGFTTQFICQ